MKTLALAIALTGLVGCKGTRRADNTERNKVVAPTADQAGESKPDVDLAAKIRKSIVDDKSLSTTAQNCKVVVKDGAVTLTGVVTSTDERDRIGSLASSSGAANVVNQLEIAK
ncbi:MAG TPA: BON domain-containing protein [Kofleriaceae bacterium]|jgi:osmotically-inducible protein OsmY|nr:BON domain-containing protein [Kofleriaceae bacterium]